MRESIPVFLFVLVAACTSVDWAPPDPELPTGWREYRLFVSDEAFVLARDESAAAEVHQRVAAARTTVAEMLGSAPERGLVLALSFDDPLPIADPEEYGKAVTEWCQQVFGGKEKANFEFGSRVQMAPGGKEIDVDPAVPLHMLTTPVRGDDGRLGLPGPLLERAQFVALVPTDTCLEECVDYMIDRALEAEGMSRFTYAAMTLVVGDPADKVLAKMREQSHEALSRTWGMAAGVEFDKDGDGVDEAEPLPIQDPNAVRYPRAVPWFVVGEVADAQTLAWVKERNWDGVVDTSAQPAPEAARAMAALGRHYLHLPRQAQLPSTAEVKRLGAFYDECRKEGRDRFVIVRGNAEYGAALVASHAYHVLGATVERALEVSAHYGAGTLHPVLAAELMRLEAAKKP